ncbi:MAG: DNA polymerase III subunit beta [Bacteroidaceae bacterium]|nr:DNA polymerase III subunit beta [Bacteroidaceae bacterium]MBR3855014.1 DNA polymerase III subunit beta [Bacteroidaceae bacterium]
MNFTVSSSLLSSRLQTISRVINSKNTIPVLDCFLFELSGNKLTLTASDPDNTLNTSFEVIECSEDFSFAISSKFLIDSLKEISEQPLRFEVNKETLELTIYYLNGKYSMVGQNAEEYPSAPVLGEGAVKISIANSVLSNGISCSLFAAADDEIRPAMCGVYFDFTPENVTFVASDGHKLARCRDYSVTGAEKSAFILPKKPATLLRNLLGKDEQEEVVLEFDGRFATFAMGEYELVCRLLDYRYPNYNAVIPQNNPHKLIVDRAALIGTLRRVAIFSSQVSLIKLHIESGKMIISAQNPDFSTAAEESITCNYDSVPMNIGFRASLLIDMLNNIPGQDVVIELADPSRAGVIVPAEQGEKQELLMLLLPVMIAE